MTSSGTATVTLPTDEQILITREFDAPKHLVYEAWTTPELVKRWWSGHRGTVTIAEIDLRVGGKWRYVMVAEGEFEVAFHGEYREIVPNERIVSTEVYEAPEAQVLPEAEAPLNIVTLTEVDGRTTLTLLVQCPSKSSATRSSTRGWRPACRRGWISWSRSRSRFAEHESAGTSPRRVRRDARQGVLYASACDRSGSVAALA